MAFRTVPNPDFVRSWALRPRIWKPAAPCPECAYLNDADFNFCQRCGFRSEVLADLGSRTKLVVDLATIDRRLDHLRQQRSNKSYERQKPALHKLLSSFLVSLPVAKSFASASPSDILKFLVWKDVWKDCRS